MNILQFTLPHHPSVGGIYNSHKIFKESLGSQIVEISPSHLWNKTRGDYQIKISGIGFLGKVGIPLNLFETLSTLQNLKIDLVSIHSLFHIHSIIGYWFAKKNGIPYVFVPHGTLDPYVFSYTRKQKKLWMNFIGKKLINNSCAVICATSREAEKADVYLRKANVEICPWGIDTPELLERLTWRQEIRHKLNIPLNEKILLFLGRINSMKRPLETAIAFQNLKPKGWKLVIVGYPEDMKIMKKIENICDEQWVHYHPPVDSQDKWKFFASADAFVNLSHRENFGYSVVEAAMVGLPILISDGVDIYPMLKSAGAADVVSLNSETAIIDGLDVFLSKNLSELQEMGLKARKLALEHFTYNSFDFRLKNIIKKYINY
jgi:glycosyltransferase involved in cell wall biosynthesis